MTRTYLINIPDYLKDLPAIVLVGDPERGFYFPHGITAVMGGEYGSCGYDLGEEILVCSDDG